MSFGVWFFYTACALVGLTIGIHWASTSTRFKWWLVWKMEPWYEERASLEVAWRVFAREHNTSGARPICAYNGWEAELDAYEKATVYEFPGGDPDAPPDCLAKMHDRAEARKRVL